MSQTADGLRLAAYDADVEKQIEAVQAGLPRYAARARKMSGPVWLDRRAIELLHRETVAEHGGADDLRDEGLFESALRRLQNLFAYKNVTDVSRLAACCGFGVAKNHPFVDGDKRIAFIASGLFLRLNGCWLVAGSAYRAVCRVWCVFPKANLPTGFARITNPFERHANGIL